jgi:hypothetical protein
MTKPNTNKNDTLNRLASDLHQLEDKKSESKAHADPTSLKSFLLSWRLVVIVLIMAIAIGSPIAWFKVWLPYSENQSKEAISSNAIVAVDHTWDKTKISKSEVGSLDINPTQYIRHSDKTYSCFAFKGKNSNPGNTVKAVLAFGDTKSRDWLGQQSSVLAYGMKKGTISTDLCFLLTDDEYSVLATEALSEIDFNNFDNTWNAALKLAMVDSSQYTTTDQRITAVLNVVDSISNADKKVSISKYSLKNGSFVQWAKEMSDANKVEAIPAVFVNGKNKTASNDFRLYDNDTFYTYIDGLK